MIVYEILIIMERHTINERTFHQEQGLADPMIQLERLGVTPDEIQHHIEQGTDLELFAHALHDEHHSSYLNTPLQTDLKEAGQHWSDWE